MELRDGGGTPGFQSRGALLPPSAGSPRREQSVPRELRGSIRSGYVLARSAGHPVAHADGRVFAHRAILYDAIGPGGHPCYHCRWPVYWEDGTLVVDHLNFERADNALQNLRPSCLACNSRRTKDGPLRGERHGGARLTEAQVIAIRAATDSVRAIAVEYGISEGHAARVRSGRRWSYLAAITAEDDTEAMAS